MITVLHERVRWTSQKGVEFAQRKEGDLQYGGIYSKKHGWTDIRYALIDPEEYEMDIVKDPGKTVPRIAVDTGAVLAINGPFAYNGNPIGYIVKDEKIINDTVAAEKWADFIQMKDGNIVIGQIDRNNLEGIKLAFTSTPRIVVDGKIHILPSIEGTPDDVMAGRRPRTGIGITKDNKMIVVVADGDSRWDAGLRVDELAAVMVKLGADQALNLDGGGSSCMVQHGRPISANKGTRPLGAAIIFKPKNGSKLRKADMTSSMHFNNPVMKPKGLVVHTTANRDRGADAVMHDRYYDNNSDRVSVHWTVDNQIAVLSVPENRAAWHAGNREYNMDYIGMEICENNVSDDVLDMQTYNNAVQLAADILRRHSWGIENMIQHRDVPGREWKNCPNRTLIDWAKFKADVEKVMGNINPDPEDKKEIRFRVQVGAFTDREGAEKLVEELRKKGYSPFVVETKSVSS